MADLDRSLTSSWETAILRRMGVIAPLLGVALTAFGFISRAREIVQPDGTQGNIAEALSPLFYGVTAGALLAIINQLFLSSLAWDEDRILQEACSPGSAERFYRLDSVFDRYSAGLTDANDRLRESSIVLHEMISTSREAFRQLCDSCTLVTASLDETTTKLAAQLASPARRFEEASELFEKATQSLGASVDQQVKRSTDRSSRLEKAVSELETAHAEAARVREEAARGELEVVRLIRSEVESLRQTMQGLGGPLQSLSESVNSMQIRGTKDLEAGLKSFNAVVTEVTRQMSAAAAKMDKQAASGDQLVQYQGSSVTALKQASDSLAAVVRSLESLGRNRPWWLISRSQDPS